MLRAPSPKVFDNSPTYPRKCAARPLADRYFLYDNGLLPRSSQDHGDTMTQGATARGRRTDPLSRNNFHSARSPRPPRRGRIEATTSSVAALRASRPPRLLHPAGQKMCRTSGRFPSLTVLEVTSAEGLRVLPRVTVTRIFGAALSAGFFGSSARTASVRRVNATRTNAHASGASYPPNALFGARRRDQARTGFSTSPLTSVSRTSRPMNRYVSRL